MTPKKIKKKLRVKRDAAKDLYLKGKKFVDEKDFKAAAILFYSALKLYATADAYYGLSYCLKNLGQYQEALHCLDEALKEPRYQTAEMYTTAGHMARDAGLSKAAVRYYELTGDESKEMRLHLGDAYAGVGDYDTAEGYLKTAATDPELAVSAEKSLAIIELKRGNYEAAENMLDRLYRIDPSSVGLSFADVLLARRKFDGAAEVAEGVLKDSKNDVAKRKAHFFAGNAYDKLGQYEKAWHHFAEGNKLKHMVYRPETMEQNVEKTVRQWPHRRPMKEAVVNPVTPVFIVGMPRSGTSLTEQILGRHTLIHAAGEIDLIDDGKDPYEYRKKITDMTILESHVTNKNPYNFVYLGQIDQKFDARIICTQRNIKDNILSVFQQDFTNHHPYAYDIKHIRHYYQQYVKLMEHWQRIGIPMLNVNYEDLVSDPETEVRRMLDFLGLEFEEACLHPESSSRIVKTASIHQVRNPINTSSVERWRNYEGWLEA